ncbi:unnamed protein product [Rotaria magnacalcarata]
MFYQKGENKNGGVLVLVRLDIQATRIECKLPNVCVLDIKGEEILRIIGVYAPDSKSWIWKDLSPLLTKKGVMFGDFNVDIVQDDKKAEIFLAWIDTHFLAPFTPASPTSLLKPHPYTDSPLIDYDNVDEPIPEVKLDKLILTVQTKRKKKSLDAHDINGNKSRWFSIEKGGPQGSVLTPTVFIIYHNDMGQFLSECTCHFFADDVAAIVSGQLGVRYTSQCIDLERRVKSFLDSLEYYSCLADQPLNRTNSARAIGSPKFNVMFASGDDNRICWKPEYKYLGYIISSRLGWGKLLKDVQCKVR